MIQQFHLGDLPKRTESRVSRRYLYTVFITALFTTGMKRKQPTRPSIDEGSAKCFMFIRGILFSLQKEGDSNNMEETSEHHAQ